MKYPCNIIKDLLPLYYDAVCSEESKKIIEDHLKECTSCKDFYEALCDADKMVVVAQNAELELKKAESFRIIKKKIRGKQFLAAILAVLVAAVIVYSTIGLLKSSEQVISYQENITVFMVDGSLMSRLEGNQADYVKIKRVETESTGQKKTYLFFYMSGTKWDELMTNDAVVSETVLCAADKGAADIDGVFYYTGDYTGIERMNSDDLQKKMEQAVLLWSK